MGLLRFAVGCGYLLPVAVVDEGLVVDVN